MKIELNDKVEDRRGRRGEAVILTAEHARVVWEDGGGEEWVSLRELEQVRPTGLLEGTEAMF